MKTVPQLLVISLIVLLTDCVSVNFQSNRRAETQPAFRRILVESRLPKTKPTYLPTFQTAFPAGYQVCTISNSPISFDNPQEAREKQQRACQSEVLLTIDFNRNYTSGGGHYISSSNELYLEMKNLATDQPFWKAIVTTDGSNEIPPGRIVNKLIEDGVIDQNVSVMKERQTAGSKPAN